MKVLISYRDLERYAYTSCSCSKEFGEYVVSECHRDGEFIVNPKDAEFDKDDLEVIVRENLDEVIDILVNDYKEELLKALGRKERKERRHAEASARLDAWLGE